MSKKDILTFKDFPSLDYAITSEKGILKSIDLCLKEKMYIPALIITYSGIDTMSFLSMPEGQNEHHGEDFVKWVEKYMKFSDGSSYSGIDIWSARCGMIHYIGSDTKLTKNGKAHKISYAMGNEKFVKRDFKDKNTLLLGVEQLIKAFNKGVMDCITELLADDRKAKIAELRLNKLYNYYSKELYQLKTS